ncbi:MAG: phosphate ABC transporter substrate-binding protein PstS [Gammaproteobacteria bacterium]
MRRSTRIRYLLAWILLATAGVTLPALAAGDVQIAGAGGTAIYPVLANWAAEYHELTGIAVNYQPIGSGGGIQQIEQGTVAFANTDMPLTPAALRAHDLIQFPALIIGITPVVNLPGLRPGELVLDGALLAGIYLGKIRYWDNPAIAVLNPGLHLPHQAIVTVHRSDGSGTTFNFTNYLSRVSPAWRAQVGADTAVAWPNGVGGKGNAGVASFVQQIRGSIGYVEYAFTQEAALTWVRLRNRAGQSVAPNLATFAAAARGADFAGAQDFNLTLNDELGADAWPITATTYMLMRRDYDSASNRRVLDFCRWFFAHGQERARQLNYVPVPAAVVKLIENYWRRELRA